MPNQSTDDTGDPVDTIPAVPTVAPLADSIAKPPPIKLSPSVPISYPITNFPAANFIAPHQTGSLGIL